MSTRKFAADKIAKRFNKKIKDADDDQLESANSSDAEESEFERDISYNPSNLRQIEVPKYQESKKSNDFDGHAHFSDYSDNGEEEYEEENPEEEDNDQSGYSLDSGDDGDQNTDDELMGIHDAELDELEAQLRGQEEEEEDEGGKLVSEVQKQREKDLKVARGNRALQEQKKRILSLFLKIHPLIGLINQLPPISLDDEAPFNPYSIAAEDEEIAQAFKEAADAIEIVRNDFIKLKSTLVSFYDWKEEEKTDKMMEIITHWGQRLRQSSGVRSGTVINRPIEQQITAALNDRETLVQPSRRVREKRIYGLDEVPEFLHANYDDTDFYDKQMREIIAEKNPEALAHVKTSKPTKATLRSKQVNYDVIPELQNYMSATMKPIPDTIDAMLRSIMGGR